MEIVTLYRYLSEDGICVSPIEPKCEYTLLYRLIADESKALTRNGSDLYDCIDTDTPDEWYEIFSATIEEKAQAYDILMGVTE